MSRDAAKTIERVIAAIGENDPALCASLRKLLDDSAFKAPEIREGFLWRTATALLIEMMPNADATAWAKVVSDIWQARA